MCVCVGGRKEIKRERERERQAAFLLPPLASPSPCSLSLHPSSPLLDHPPALLRARPRPPTTQTTPGPYDSPHFSVPPTITSEQVRLCLFQPALRLSKVLPALSSTFFCSCFCFLYTQCSLFSLASPSFSCMHISSLPCSTFVPLTKVTQLQEMISVRSMYFSSFSDILP